MDITNIHTNQRGDRVMERIIKKLGMAAAMLLPFLSASAYDFEVDGIYYLSLIHI